MSAVQHGDADGDRKRNKKRALIVIVSLLAASGVGSLAFAYWTQGGSGTGSASTGSTSAITLNPGSTPSGLFPGGPAQTVTGTFDNTNATSVNVSSLTASLVVNNKSPLAYPSESACSVSDFSFSNAKLGGVAAANYSVPKGTGVGSWSIDLAMNETGVAQDNCKGVTLSITYNAS